MKFYLRDLKIGDLLIGKVEEVLPEEELLFCFEGDLLRVQNESRRPFNVGDRVKLVVTGLSPLRLQLVTADRHGLASRRAGRLDVSV